MGDALTARTNSPHETSSATQYRRRRRCAVSQAGRLEIPNWRAKVILAGMVLLDPITAALGLTDAQVDALFIAAEALEV